MPISSSSTTAKTSIASQKAELKPIGICLASNQSITSSLTSSLNSSLNPSNCSSEMSTASTTLATNRVTTSSSNANYYHSSSSTTSTAIPVGALSVMVARFSADNSRQQTVILHPRPLNSGTRASLMNSSMSGSAMRGSTVIAGQTFNTTTTPSLSSSSTSISVRTTHLISGQQHQTHAVPLLNLSSVSNANTSVVSSISSSNIKQFTPRPFITTSGSIPIESMSLVVANANDGNVIKAMSHPIRLHQASNDIKINSATPVHNINKITSGSRVASTIVTAQPTKMISIGSSGQSTAPAVSHVARVGIIGQLQSPSTVNKSGILNLTSSSLQKGFIINSSSSAANLNTGSTIHNMVNVSGPVASFAQSPQNAKLSLNATANNMNSARHSVVSSALSSTPYLHQNQQQLLQSTTASTSPLRPTILSSPASSPIKQQQLQTTTPSSPRPSILIRKRIANDSQGSATPTTLFKTSLPATAISGSTTSLRVANIAINSNHELTSQSNQESRSNDISLYCSSDASMQLSQANCLNSVISTAASGLTPLKTAPLTPNSEGNQTPRKKPRKQLLEPLTLKSSQNIQLLNSSSDTKLNDDNCIDKESAVQVNKKPRFSLLSSYNMQWKSLQYHFLRYSDVRPKPEKKLTLSELSNEGLKKRNGWKIHHLATQMEVMSDNEVNVHQRLTQFLQAFEKEITCAHTSSSNTAVNTVCQLNQVNAGGDSSFDINSIAIKLNDLIRGNLQRSNLFTDQINEAKQLVIKLTNDHKERVGKITKKCANKRTYITK